MSVGLQELMPAGGMRGSARVAHLAGGATRPPQRLRAAARPFPNAGFFVGGAITQPLFLARPAGTPSSAHRGRTRPLPPPGEPPNARAAPGGTASTAPRSLGATFENGSSQRHRGARWWLCRRTFRLMTCTDRMSVARRCGGVQFVSVRPRAGGAPGQSYVEVPKIAQIFVKKVFFP